MVFVRRWLVAVACGVAALAVVLSFALSRRGAVAEAAGARSAAKTVRIDVKDFAFSSSKVTVRVGTKIVWTNRDDMQHDVTRDGASGPKSKLLEKGDRYAWTPRKPGSFRYHCTPHPFMKGTIVVKR